MQAFEVERAELLTNAHQDVHVEEGGRWQKECQRRMGAKSPGKRKRRGEKQDTSQEGKQQMSISVSVMVLLM